MRTKREVICSQQAHCLSCPLSVAGKDCRELTAQEIERIIQEVRKMSDTKLKPCPFCGGEVKIFIAPIKATTMFICKKCGADVCFYGAEHQPKASKAWNRRVNND